MGPHDGISALKEETHQALPPPSPSLCLPPLPLSLSLSVSVSLSPSLSPFFPPLSHSFSSSLPPSISVSLSLSPSPPHSPALSLCLSLPTSLSSSVSPLDLSLPSGGTVRRWLSNPKGGSHGNPTMLALSPWTSSLHNSEKINSHCLSHNSHCLLWQPQSTKTFTKLFDPTQCGLGSS